MNKYFVLVQRPEDDWLLLRNEDSTLRTFDTFSQAMKIGKAYRSGINQDVRVFNLNNPLIAIGS